MLWATVLVVGLASAGAEYHYKLRGPPAPPPPPPPPSRHYSGIPSPFGKIKWRPPMLRGPHLHHHHNHNHLEHHQPPPHFHLHGPPHHPIVRVPMHPHHHKNPIIPLSIAGPTWETNPGFRAPIQREKFNPSPLTEFEYHVPKPAQSPQSALVLQTANDDDKGPIHTIPAPNLSLSGKPYTPPTISHSSTIYGKHTDQGSLALHGLDTSSGLSLSQPIRNHFENLATSGVTVQQTQGYEVHEQSNDQAGYTLDGQPTYYAPDPDPSLPAPKVPATTDPQSFPSNGKPPADLYLLQHQSKPASEIDPALKVNALTSQDLLQLLQGVPQQQHQLVDSYGVPLLQQPQLQQHFLQQASVQQGLPELYQTVLPGAHQQVEVQHGDNSLVLKAIRDELHPQFQNFNYQEQYPEGISREYSVVEDEYQEQAAAESSPTATVVRKPSASYSKPTTSAYQNHVTNQRTSNSVQGTQPVTEVNERDQYNDKTERNVVSPSYYSQIGKGNNGMVSTPFYTTVPSRQVAETLASLASAGSSANKRNNEIKTNSDIVTRENVFLENDQPKKQSTNDGETKHQNAVTDNSKEIRIYETTFPESSHVGGNRVQQEQDSQDSDLDSNPAPAEVVEYVEYEDVPTDAAYDENRPDDEEQEEISKNHPEFGTRIRPKRTVI